MATTTPSKRRRAGRVIVLLITFFALPLAFIVSCQSRLIYFPRPYGAGVTAGWQRQSAGKTVDFQTSQGRQRAFLQGNLSSPRNLWIVCGGNGTVALDWSEWLARHAPRQDAWLLVDFPGYGDCEGAPSPARIRESLAMGIPAACRLLGWPEPPDPARLRFFGHSLGGAACLIGSKEFRIQRGVLIAPFTSTMEMSRVVTGLPLGWLVIHRFDNTARLSELARRGNGAVIILHGSDDEVIPVSMSRELASRNKGVVVLREIPDGRHNTVQSQHPDEVADALREIGN